METLNISASRLPLKREAPLAFGPFQLYAARKLLLNHGEPVRLGGRAIDLLLALVRRAGQLVSQRDLVAQVWPNTIVEDSSLRVHVAALRRALRDGAEGRCYIVNVPGRGYIFSAAVEAREQDHPAPPRPGASLRLSSMVGRAHDLDRVADRLRAHRLVSIVGPGGVGKSTLAAAAAARSHAGYAGGVHRLDLHSIDNAQQLAREAEPLAQAGESRGALLILDNCEHLIGPASAIAERLLLSVPGLSILATSREPLLVDGEYVCRIAPLAVPPAHGAAPSNPNAFPALQLFLERARSAADVIDLDMRLAADICRRLDGLPLALEIAAAGVATLGLKGLSDQLARQQLSVVAARRNGPASQASLLACYNRSYSLLPAHEQLLFPRLAALAPGFSLESACAIAGDIPMTAAQATSALMALVSKSLVMADLHPAEARYRLLNTARAYAAEHHHPHPARPLLSGEKNVHHA